MSVAPTLKTLQLLGEAGPLRPVSLRLVTALWRRQDRCFPYLQRMLQAPGTATVSLETGLNEGLVAKAACIRDICIERYELLWAFYINCHGESCSFNRISNETVPLFQIYF